MNDIATAYREACNVINREIADSIMGTKDPKMCTWPNQNRAYEDGLMVAQSAFRTALLAAGLLTQEEASPI